MADLPDAVVAEAARLTRLARGAIDDAEAAAYRADRDASLADHGFVARVRDGDGDPILVCYPANWLTDGVVDQDAIDALDRAVERPLAGEDTPDEWATIDADNRTVANAVVAAHGPAHGATAHAFADFMSNHYAARLGTAGDRECREFLGDYLPRNAWPSEEQLARACTSLQIVFEAADADVPTMLEDEDS